MIGFEDFPEFIETDERELIDIENENIRHSIILDGICEGASILDMGPCMCASGAYALMHSATYYEGVEIVPSFYENSLKNMKKYFTDDQYKIHNMLFLDYFDKYKDNFDIVLLMNMFYYVDDQRLFLEEVAKRARKYIVVESPNISFEHDSDIPIVEYKTTMSVKSGKKKKDMTGIPRLTGLHGWCKCPNLAFFEMVLSQSGFKYFSDYEEMGTQHFPERYNEENRFLALFERI